MKLKFSSKSIYLNGKCTKYKKIEITSSVWAISFFIFFRYLGKRNAYLKAQLRAPIARFYANLKACNNAPRANM